MTFNQPFQLQNFPFDVQDLTCMFALFDYTNSRQGQKLKVIPMYGGATFSSKFVEPNDEYKVFRDHRVFHEADGYVCCTFKICRQWHYYFCKVIVILSLVTLTALGAFIAFESYIEQVTHLSTVLLTEVAYLYSIQHHIPKLAYLTLLDVFVFGNVFFLFAIFIQLAVIEKVNMDMTEIVNPSSSGMAVADVVLVANIAGWVIMISIFAMVAVRARFAKLKSWAWRNPLEQRKKAKSLNVTLFAGVQNIASW